MVSVFGTPLGSLLGQLTLGLVNGSFYAMLSLGLAVIFGMLNIVNFAHGALYMMGAFLTWIGLEYFGISYWWSLLVSPFCVGALGFAIERLFLKRLYKLDPIYGLLLTFGLALVIEGLVSYQFGVAGQPYSIPDELTGAINLGFMLLPKYRAWIVCMSLIICLLTWLVIERTRLGSYLRAATEHPELTQAFGINVPLIVMVTYGFGVGLAGWAGVLAAPATQVSPLMGTNLLIVVFAVVVIGGMGSVLGSIVTGLGLGVIESVVKVFYPQGSSVAVFLIMAIVLIIRPAGLFGRETQ